MTAPPVNAPLERGSEAAELVQRAPWAARAGALALDIVPAAAVLTTAVLVALSAPMHGVWWWASATTAAITVLLTVFNRLVPPIRGGQSIGRAVFGIRIVHRNATAGPWRLLLRDLAHLLDTATAFAGWAWPLWDSRGRTFADMLLRTEARRIEPRLPDREARARAGVVVLSATILCAGGAALSYWVVGGHDRSVTAVRAEIASQGPRMVVQLLSYRPESVQVDFDHALSLATDRYRAQLSAQQQEVQKATPVRNEYWVTNSSVLTATPNSATMLVFLQGRRGTPPDQRYITASVRATFVKSAAAEWRVDALEIVTKPQPTEAKP